MAPESLLSLATLATAKHVSCEQMLLYPQPWDEDLLKNVSFLACPQDAKLIKTIARVNLRDDDAWKRVEEDKIKHLRQIGFMVTAEVEGYSVSFTFEKQQITSTSCESCQHRIWCSHVIAAILYRIHNSVRIHVHPPMTEALSSLDRNQLQKLLQYAIKEYPAGILGKVFMWVDEVRDGKSQVYETPGLPDPTFGLVSGETSTWDLTINELKQSFGILCHRVCTWASSDDFPYSKEESKIRDSSCYKYFIQKVVDFIQIGEVETAGQILITLLTEAANVALSREGNITKQYEYLLKTLERVCSLYILEFTGKARSKLIELCESLNKTMNITSNCSDWAELPKLSLLFPFVSAGVNQKSMFYEPLCASLIPDPSQEFYKLLSGNVLRSNSTYDEPLPLMIMRFESLRFWDCSENGQKNVLKLGAVILRKIMEATQILTVLLDRSKPHTEMRPTAGRMKRQKSMDDVAIGIPLKKRSVSSWTTDGTKDAPLTYNYTRVSDSERTNVNEEKTTNTPDNESTSVEDGRRCIYTDIYDLLADVAKSNTLENSNIESVNKADCLQLILNSSRIRTQQEDANNLPKEMLSFCLSHITYCMYKVGMIYSVLRETDRKLIASATLRALELARYQIRNLSEEDHSFLQSLQQKLFECYKENIVKLVHPSFSARLETTYLKKLCHCNTNNMCFFDNALPLPLIAFLVKRALQYRTNTQEQKQQACYLCLYTLCHSDKPFDFPLNDNEYSEPYRFWKKSFKDITELLFYYIKDMPERDVFLAKLLTHYSKIQDKNAVFVLCEMLEKFPWEGLSEGTLIGMTNVTLNGIAFCNIYNLKPWNLNFDNMLESLFAKIGSVFITLVIDKWADIVMYFRPYYLETLVEKMKTAITHDSPLRECMLTSITKYFSGAFEHTVHAIGLLKLFGKGDRNIHNVFDVIKTNSDNFTPEALLDVAKLSMECEDVDFISEKIFTDYATGMITLALKRIKHNNESVASSVVSYKDTFDKQPDPHIQWVFQALIKHTGKSAGTYRQFKIIIGLVLEAYSEDLTTILSLLSTAEQDEPLFDKCKSMFGEKVRVLCETALLQATESLNPRGYNSFVSDVSKVQKYFAMYVSDGYEAFKSLLLDISRQNRSKTKLITELRNTFDF